MVGWSSSAHMPDGGGPIRLKGPQQHQRLVEHLVEKRVRCLEYLRHFHTAEDGLWMNTVRLGKTDIREYFESMTMKALTEPKFAAPKRTATGEPVVTIPHITGGPESQHLVTSTALKPLPNIGSSTVETTWSAEYLPKLYAVGLALSELLLFPAGGASFVNAVYEVFLELDVVFASGVTSRALAGRQLKNHRLAKRRSDAESLVPESPSASGVDQAAPSTLFSLQTSKPYFVQEQSFGANLPSYDLLIPSLCTTCILVYRRMCDFDSVALGDPDFTTADVARMILHIDRRLKKLFFGNISKQIGKLARLRTVQHTRVLTDHVFGAYTQLDEGLLEELMNTAGTFANAARQHTEPQQHRHDDPTTATSAASLVGSLQSPAESDTQQRNSWRSSAESILVRGGRHPFEDNVFMDNDDETY